MPNKHKKKFNSVWKSQTDIGKNFGLSAIAIGKILIEHNLKNPITKLATEKSISEGYAISRPLKDGTQFFMWNKEKLEQIVGVKHKRLSKERLQIEEVKKAMDEIDRVYVDNDKLACLLSDDMQDTYPPHIIACATFERHLMQCDNNFSIWYQKYIIDYDNVNNIYNMLKAYHPEYVEQFEKLTVLL